MTYTVTATGGPVEPLEIAGLPAQRAYALVGGLLRRQVPVGEQGSWTIAVAAGQLTVAVTPATSAVA